MASIIKSNTYADFNGREILTANNDGALTTQKILYPAFEAYLSSDQTVTDATITKCQFDTERFDTDNAYDNSTNYRFTPQVAGKYFIYSYILFEASADNTLASVQIYIYKNGSQVNDLQTQFYTNYEKKHTPLINSIVDLNGSTDYVEIFGFNNIISGTATFGGSSSKGQTIFGAYRIGS